MPVAVWRDLMARHYPNSGWVRLSHETIAALAAYKSARGMLDLDHAVTVAVGHRAGGGAVTPPGSSAWDRARTVADAVLYEGYLLYPYRGTSTKNQSRWQFGVLGPPGAADAGLGEDDALAAQFLVEGGTDGNSDGNFGGNEAITLVVRFLQLQHRRAERALPDGGFEPVDELTTPGGSWLTWDEAVECEMSFGPIPLGDEPSAFPVTAGAATDIESLDGGRLVRERREVRGVLAVGSEPDGDLRRVSVRLSNVGGPARRQGRRHRAVADRNAPDRRSR